MTEYASLTKYLSKNVQVVIQVVNNKKVMAKTPREANLHGNWCVHKGLNRSYSFVSLFIASNAMTRIQTISCFSVREPGADLSPLAIHFECAQILVFC